ncbi:unnamed protein product [Mesocestoides corti]|uniref:C2H2-type domain-containing protein n=1 Tax=Mesocestoides corti TaxID=53468 RepID=A0A0R3UGP0_MESCO|nr:unnamed protein product [Mesocestoides corti]
MARYKDIFDMIEYATDERCSNRLLAFAKVRHTVRSGPLAAQSAPRQLTWSTDYKNFSANNFERAYERLVRGPAMPNVDTLQNSHWLPDRDVFGNSIEENRYNLQDFVSELTTEHKQQHAELAMIFQMVSGLQNSGQDSSSRDEKKFSDACKRTLEIRREVDASKAFWNDVSRNLTDRPQNLEEMASTVQTVFESMDQSIRCCLDVLNINPKAKEQPESSRKDDVKPDTGFEYGGRSVEPKIQTSTHASSKLRQLEIRLRKTPKKQSSTSKPDLEPTARHLVEPMAFLLIPVLRALHASSTAQSFDDLAKSSGDSNDDLRNCRTEFPSAHFCCFESKKLLLCWQSYLSCFVSPSVAVSCATQIAILSAMALDLASVRRLRSDFEGRNQLPLQSRPINVQCNDCHLMFTNLEKLLSHKCHKVANSAPHRTHVPLPIPTSRDSDVSLYSFFCEACNLGFEERSLFKAHLLTPRHLFSSRRLEKINQSAPTASGHLANGSAEGLSAVSRDPISHTPQTRCKNNSESETVDPLIFEDSQIEWVPLEGDVDVSQNDFDDMFNENAKQMTAEEAKLYEMLPLGIERKVVQKPPSNPDYHLNLLPGGTEHVSTSQQSLMHVKATAIAMKFSRRRRLFPTKVETRRPWRTVESRTAESSDPPHDSTEHATVQQPEHTNKTRTLEAARGNSTSSEPAAGRKKLQGRGSKSQPSRSDTFYCNFCSVFLESVEIAKHVTSPSHPLETIDNAIYAAAPPLASDSVIQDGEYIAVYVPTLHKPDENGRRVIFTQHVSLRPRQCHVCGAVFDDDEVLRRHLSFHGRNL